MRRPRSNLESQSACESADTKNFARRVVRERPEECTGAGTRPSTPSDVIAAARTRASPSWSGTRSSRVDELGPREFSRARAAIFGDPRRRALRASTAHDADSSSSLVSARVRRASPFRLGSPLERARSLAATPMIANLPARRIAATRTVASSSRMRAATTMRSLARSSASVARPKERRAAARSASRGLTQTSSLPAMPTPKWKCLFPSSSSSANALYQPRKSRYRRSYGMPPSNRYRRRDPHAGPSPREASRTNNLDSQSRCSLGKRFVTSRVRSSNSSRAFSGSSRGSSGEKSERPFNQSDDSSSSVAAPQEAIRQGVTIRPRATSACARDEGAKVARKSRPSSTAPNASTSFSAMGAARTNPCAFGVRTSRSGAHE